MKRIYLDPHLGYEVLPSEVIDDWHPCRVCGPDASHEDVNCAVTLYDHDYYEDPFPPQQEKE